VENIMSLWRIFIAVIFFVSTSLAALAAEQTATLKVGGMTCASCAYQAQKALISVDGVRKAEVSKQDNQAVVTFDDEKSNVAALAQALVNVGYTAELIEPEQPATTEQ